ncbi:MAG: cytochrome c [Roseovarius sp.]|nr:cytochrome c [Roseovarius sp.]
MRTLSTYGWATVPSLLVLGFFVWFANWIPQTRWDPPKVRAIDASMSPVQLAQLGEAIVRERGCLTCHTIEPGGGIKGLGRGPNLAGLAERRANGVEGGAGTLVEYLTEALYAPGAYLVEGFSNIMPASTRAPAKLSREEIAAVVAYLESLGGTPSVTVATLPAPAEATPVAATAAAEETASTDPEAIMDEFACLGCHSLTPGEVLIGPPFEARVLRASAEAQGIGLADHILRSIVDPWAVQSDEFPPETMPDDYAEQLSAGQLYAIVRYLAELEDAQ